MSIPKRQHWVPRFYLKYFATPDSQSGMERVWIFNRKGEGEPTLTNITNIAAENHLYSPRREDGTRDPQIEKRLSEMESALATLWPRLANDFVDLGSEKVRRALSLFLSIQSLRHPERRNAMAEHRQHVVDQIRDKPRREDGRPMPQRFTSGKVSFDLDSDALYEIETATGNDDVREWLIFIEENAIRFAETLSAKRWSIVFIDEPLFVTSDFPFYVASQQHARYQIGGEAAVILFPLSPTRILCFDDQNAPANKYYKAPIEAADLYNALTWVNTESFMISPRNIFDVLEGIQRITEEAKAEGLGPA